ncbi:hypothetical protein I3760_04G148800 [Carya illinoinensis]|nr:hypothetical protein I3760_04G148800 [Carya illinoinensis]
MGIGDEPNVPPPSARARPPRPRSNKKRSWKWKHFTKVDDDPEDPHVACNHCGQEVGCHSKKQGTACLISLLNGCQRYKIAKGLAAKDQTKLSYETSTATDGTQLKKMVIPQYNEKMLRDALVEMIIEDEMPFTTVEKRGFRKFIKLIEPRFSLRSRKMFVTTGQRVSFMIDTWSSIKNISYMCITAHYIDSSWTLRKHIIGFKEINDHKGASIGVEIDDCLKDWGIQKVLCITVDNANANDTAIEWFKRNTIVRDDRLKQVDDSITKSLVATIVLYVRASPQRLKKFTAIEDQLEIKHSRTLCLDIPTQWKSTYMMLDVAQKYQKVFERMKVEDGGLKYALLELVGKGLSPTDTNDWTSVEFFVTCLQIFYDITMKISRSTYTTTNLMLSKYNKYWGQVEKINRLLFVAVILDPQIKLAVIEYWANFVLGAMKAASFITVLKTNLDDLYNHYKNSGQPSSSAEANSTKYPIISRIARDVLAISITTVAYESAFSTGGRVLDAFRSSLSLSTMEALVCTQNWISDTPLGLDSIGIDDESYRIEEGNLIFLFFLLLLIILIVFMI